jgi:hypothetical protein
MYTLIIINYSSYSLLRLTPSWWWIREDARIVFDDHDGILDLDDIFPLIWECELSSISLVIVAEVVPVIVLSISSYSCTTRWCQCWTDRNNYTVHLLLCSSDRVLRCDESSDIELLLWDIPDTSRDIRRCGGVHLFS